MANEVEGKVVLTGPDRDATIEAIAALVAIGGFTVSHRTEHALADAYFDTPDRQLATARLALRFRSEDGQSRITLKGEGRVEAGVVSRYELERDWSAEALEEVLEVLRKSGVVLDTTAVETKNGATAALRSLGLRPSSPRTNQRSALALADITRSVVAELDVDRVTFVAGGVMVHHYEVECEAHDTTGGDIIRTVLYDLQTRFEGLRPVTYSKLGLGEHLQHLAAAGQLTAMLGDLDSGLKPGAIGSFRMLTAEAYEEIGRTLTRM
jgi:hypothetical protein